MLRTALAFCGGVAAIHALPSVGPPAAAAWPAIAAAAAWRRRPAAAACLAGCGVAWLAGATALAGDWPCSRDREVVTLEGRIAAPAVVRPERTDFDLELLERSSDRLGIDRVRLSWYDAEGLPRAGEQWRLGARLRCPRGFANPGTADRELALLRERIDATGYVAGESRPVRIGGRPALDVEALRERVAASIARSVAPGPSAAVLQGLAVGLRGNIPDGLWEAFAATGLAHLVAISGLHVTGCALAALLLLRLAWRARLLPATRRRLAAEATVVIAVTTAYGLLAGASIPALRTVAMVALFQGLRLLRRSLPLGETLALAAAILVAIDPLAVTSTGFWLSFVATAALLAAGTAGAGFRSRALAFARGQAAITVALTPVLAASFGRLSLVAPLVNAVAIPAFSVLLLPAVLSGTALALAVPDAAAGLWRPLSAVLDATWPMLERIASWPAASIEPARPSAGLTGAAVLVALGAVVMPLGGLRAAVAVVLVALAAGQGGRMPPGEFTLTVLDVGQGLSVVVETAGHVLVFDPGPRWRSGAAAARVTLLPYLRARGLRRIDRLVVSHDDADHAGGAVLVGQAVPVAHILAPPGGGVAADEACDAGRHWVWDGISFIVLHPPPGFAGSDNERSCALRVSGPGGAALLLADPEAGAEALLAQRRVRADVVLIPHHGSATSSSPAIVAAVAARVGIVSAGFGNRYGLPRTDVVARWRSAGTTVLATAESGAVRVRFPARGGPLAIDAERLDRPHWWRAERRR